MQPPRAPLRIHVVRHGETEWSLGGRHTSGTDVPLTVHGEDQARRLGERLQGMKFSHVFTSPRRRARRTCELAGLAGSAVIEPEVREWEYGDYEGRTSTAIRADQPDWNLFADGAPGGESPAAVFSRARDFAGRLQRLEGNIAVFSHGHFLRVLATAWVGFPVIHAQRFGLNTATLGILSYEHDDRANAIISLWNEAAPTISPR